MIIAILQAGTLEGKLKLPFRQNEIDIILPVIANFSFTEATPAQLNTTPRARFIWYRQISRYKHLYKLKEVLS